MGITSIELGVKSAPGREEALSFLVDSGATYSVLPQPVWRRLGLHPSRKVTVSLADGTLLERHASECEFSFENVRATSPVILGEKGDEALLGVLTLETLGLLLNPLERKLQPMRIRA